MVADSITDSDLFHHGSPISGDFAKKRRKANWICKLKQWKIDDDRRKQWIYQWKKANVDEEEIGRRLQSFLEKLTDQKAWRIDDYEERSYGLNTKCDDDDEIDLTSSASTSPTSVLLKTSKGSSVSEDCFCCSKQMTTEEEEEVFDDAYDNWDGFKDALNSFENDKDDTPQQLDQKEPSTSQRRNKSIPDQKLFHKDNTCKHEASPHKKTIHRNSKKKKRSNSGKQQGDDEECPICSEVMDATDLSFKPCPCGFRICLFCHKKISENEARCPSCRKDYDQTSSNTGEVGFQQRGRGTIRLSPSFRGLDRA